ncbi:MAG: hypothetical protein AAF533_27745 [Acidobacteriota bacterium]
MVDLATLKQVPGVRWGVLFQGAVTSFTDELIGQAGGERIDSLGRALRLLPRKLQDADLRYEEGLVLVRRRRRGDLVVVCERNTDLDQLVPVMESVGALPDDATGGGTSSLAMTLAVPAPGEAISQVLADAGRPTIEKVEPQSVEELLGLFAEFLGPLAKAVARKEAKAREMNLDDLESGQWPGLVDSLADSITDEKKRSQFLARAEKLGA